MALTPEEQAKRREVMRSVMVKSPYIASLGIVVERWDSEGVTLRMPFDPELTNDGAVYHGGAVASLMDTTGAAAVWAGHDFDKGARAATISMTINYTGAAVQADLLADAVCVKRGRELAFSEIRVHDPEGKPVATGTLVYRIVA
ncbi:MAG TPA: PaaI family thioesterase [Acidimicrobiia bacterium]|nr:PaaI family thioesterase [Acidimicrobiia bacterium]